MSTARYALALVLALSLVAPPGQPRTTAVVDRFEGDRAVLVTDGGQQVVVGRGRLPASGRYADAVLRVTLAHGTLTSVEYDREASRRRARTARTRFDRLATSRDPSNQS